MRALIRQSRSGFVQIAGEVDVDVDVMVRPLPKQPCRDEILLGRTGQGIIPLYGYKPPFLKKKSPFPLTRRRPIGLGFSGLGSV